MQHLKKDENRKSSKGGGKGWSLKEDISPAPKREQEGEGGVIDQRKRGRRRIPKSKWEERTHLSISGEGGRRRRRRKKG